MAVLGKVKLDLKKLYEYFLRNNYTPIISKETKSEMIKADDISVRKSAGLFGTKYSLINKDGFTLCDNKEKCYILEEKSDMIHLCLAKETHFSFDMKRDEFSIATGKEIINKKPTEYTQNEENEEIIQSEEAIEKE